MSPIRMEKIESSIRLVLDFHNAFNKHDVETMMHLLSDSCSFESAHPPPEGECYNSKESITSYWQTYFQDSPGAKREIEEIFGLGLRSVVRWRVTGLSGETISLRGVDIFMIKEGAIFEHSSYVKG